MIAAILAGGMGTRLQEFTRLIPKPMVEIGGRPILWHIMKAYHSGCDVHQFCIALGFKGQAIKRFFIDYPHLMNSVRVDLASGRVSTLENRREDWVVDMIETGSTAQTGARLSRLRHILGKETFFLTYGDGVSNIDLRALLDFHKATGRVATVTAVRPPARFGALHLREDIVDRFVEKPADETAWVNGGFLVCEPKIFDYVSDEDGCVFEHGPMERLARDGELAAYRHDGFWQSMDTVRDVALLNDLWATGKAPWKIWAD